METSTEDNSNSFVIPNTGYENNTEDSIELLDELYHPINYSMNDCEKSMCEINYIGGGSYASIFKISETHCIKMCNSSKIKFLDNVMELYILSQLSHSSILKTTQVFRKMNSLIYVLPFFEHTLNEISPTLPQDILDVQRQLASAVNYLHSKCILHLDISDKNILVKKQGRKFLAVLADFSLSSICPGDCINALTKKITANCRPYENLSGCNIYGYHSDIWSLGLVFYKLKHGKNLIGNSVLPTEKTNACDHEINTNFEILKKQSWGKWPSTDDETIKMMLELNPELRITSSELCERLDVPVFERLTFSESSLTLKKRWIFLSKYIHRVDDFTISQVENLFNKILRINSAIEVTMTEDEKNLIFLSCFSIIKTTCSSNVYINEIISDISLDLVYEVFKKSKGNFLSFSS